ncbi:hypothetical protein GCM10009574_006830 [Streptomyces asiaticus]
MRSAKPVSAQFFSKPELGRCTGAAHPADQTVPGRSRPAAGPPDRAVAVPEAPTEAAMTLVRASREALRRSVDERTAGLLGEGRMGPETNLPPAGPPTQTPAVRTTGRVRLGPPDPQHPAGTLRRTRHPAPARHLSSECAPPPLRARASPPGRPRRAPRLPGRRAPG